MAKLARLYKVRLTRDGYIMNGDRYAGAYRGTPNNVYRCEVNGDGENGWQEFRAHFRVNARVLATQWLKDWWPEWKVRNG